MPLIGTTLKDRGLGTKTEALLVSDASIVGIPTGVILGAALLNAAIAALLVYPMRAAMSRWAVDELPAW